ncbi:MAG: Ppx/GppA family phosphatase [Arthrospira sp. SH-MAG29]|nr:Ppx/GppA phosphatase family protein [Arthrospira sp. SH-MAG29]MBS0017344.1 Ppx/GppA family phosphatase [Arthrospira sp. SH-MAG29]
MAKSVPLLGKQLGPTGEHTLASIDLGTNSLHMVIVRIDKSLPAFTIIAREKDTVRLGDCGPKGQLKPEVIDRAIATLRRFQELAKTFNVEQVVAVATSAVREAPNGRDFIKRVSDELDLEVNLISGPEEARRIYLGVLSAMEFHDQPHVIIDIGGGSTELILGDGGEPKFLSSTKVGAVRLTQEYIETDPISRTEFLFVQAYIRGMLERPVDELRLHLPDGKVPHLVGTSGTIETLAVMIAKEKLGTEPTPLAGYQISLNELHNIVSRLRKLSYQERLQIPGINDRRAEIILAGALILQEAMSLLEIESLTICERSLREGVIVDWMLTHGLIEDRLRYESSIRQRSILKIAQKYNVDLEHGERVAAFSLSLFDQTHGILHDYGLAERELLWAAAILHNCGLYISHSSHHKHSYYLIRNGELLGYTETEIDMIANLARYHRKSAPKKKHENYQNLSKKNRHIIDRLNPLMRLAVALDRRQIGAVAEVTCQCDRDQKEFKLILKPVDPQDNCALELWSLDLKKDVFEEQYNLTLAAFLEH